jgi:hypothetical protein
MKVNELVRQLLEYDQNSEVIIYDDDNDRTLQISCIDIDEGSEADEDAQIMIIV